MRRILFSLILLCLIGLPATAQQTDIFSSSWRADYFNNPYLAGTPNITRFDTGIGFDWDETPVAGVPAQNFSVRWGKGGDLSAGTYRFIVTASFGFRLYIDNEVIIDTWEGEADGITIGRDVFIDGGYHNIQLDYRTIGESGYIYLDWGLADDTLAPQSLTEATINTVTVTANTLNVRSEPRIANNISVRITRGQQFTQLAVSPDGRWVQLDLGNGTTGWVSALHITSSTATVTTDGLTGQSLRSTTRLLIRNAPDTASDAQGLLLRGEDATIIGRSRDGNWWQINDGLRVGWVNANFVILSPDVNADDIDFTD